MIVNTKTFFTNTDYLGKAGADLYPKLLDDLIELFDGDYTEVILSGAQGWGKLFIANLIMCRVLYEVSCLKNPQHAYGLAENSTLSFPIITDIPVFNRLKELLNTSPYFRDKFPFTAYPEEIELPNNIWLGIASEFGRNIFAAIIDTTTDIQREKDCNLIAARMKSRFMKDGKLPGLLITIAQANSQSNFMKERIEKAKNDPKIFVMDYAEWEVKPKGFYGDKKFWVSVGAENQPPKIIKNKIEAESARKKGIEVIEVPLEFLTDFERDVNSSLRDLAGVVINADS